MKLFRGDPRAARMAELEAENRELRAKIARVREIADDLANSDDGKHSYEFGLSEAGKRIITALNGDR